LGNIRLRHGFEVHGNFVRPRAHLNLLRDSQTLN
jgi:hypothetical protein